MTSRYDRIAPRHFITAEDIRGAQTRGEAQLAVRDNSTITDEARELAMKFGIRLDVPGAPARTPSAAPAAAPSRPPIPAPASSPAVQAKTQSEDSGLRVADAIAAVLAELNLGARAASLAPVLTRRVYAGLAKAAERK